MFGCPTCSNSLGRNNPNREGKTQTTKRLHQTTHVKYFTCLFRFPLCHITGLETSFSRPRFYRKILCLSLWWHLPCHERLRISQAPKGLTMVLSWPHQLTIYKFARIRKVVQESKTTNYRIYRSWTKWHVLWRIYSPLPLLSSPSQVAAWWPPSWWSAPRSPRTPSTLC